MQVRPDVRVEHTDPIGQIPVSPKYAAGLENGDVIVATVEHIQGDMLMLRLHDGSLLNAELQGEMRFSEGDVIEAAVSKDGGRCLLYILNVLRAGSPAAKDAPASVTPQTLSAMLAVIKRNPGLDADIALYLAQNNIPDTPENITALTQMSRGTGIGTLLGQILGFMTQAKKPEQPASGAPGLNTVSQGAAAQNGQPAAGIIDQNTDGGKALPGHTVQGEGAPLGNGVMTTPHQPNAHTPQSNAQPDMGNPVTPVKPDGQPGDPQQTRGMQAQASEPATQGEAMGAKTAPMATDVTKGPVEQGTAGSPAQAQPQESAAGTVRQAESPQGPQPDTQPVSTPDITGGRQAPQPMDHGAQAMEAQPPAGQILPRGSGGASPPDGAVMMDGGAVPTEGTADPAPTQGPDGRIDEMIRELFLLPDEKNGLELKKTADGMSRSLKILKSELIQTDIKNRELCLKSAEQALRQLEMSDRTVHFEHMQLPFALKEGEHRTTELYVFRRRGDRDKKAAGDGLSILVALDTEHMGRVETLIRTSGGGIALEFRLQEPGMTDMFKENSVPLQEAVEAAGYHLTGIRFAGLEKKTTVLNAGEMVSLDAGEANHGIDVQI